MLSRNTSHVPSNYTDLHRRFLQLIMNRRMLSYEDAFGLFCKIFQSMQSEDDDSEARNPKTKDMEHAVSIINKVIKRMNMEIQSAQDELTCQKYYLYVNTVENYITRKFTKFSTAELEFFKKVLFEIVSSEDGSVSSTVCLNLNSSLPGNMTKSNIETLIKKFCKDLWLCQKDGKVYLSLLSIVELEPLLKEYASICHLCKHIVIQGYRCDNCPTLLHLHCVCLYTKGADRRRNCPSCPVCNIDQPEMLATVRNIALHNEDGESMPSTSSQSK